ncbi:hypothetical protein [Methylonatrum kenyense]|nr:hypothetical protein [Methylonatrum kenyense]
MTSGVEPFWFKPELRIDGKGPVVAPDNSAGRLRLLLFQAED